MRIRFVSICAIGFALVGAFGGGCGNSGGGGNDASTQACTPGDSKACTGAGGCAGGQVCNADGTGYGACDCGTSDSGSDGATDASSDGDAAAWTPASLNGLALWVEGTSVDVDGGAVTLWPDQSTHHLDLTTAGSPTLVSSAIDGKPAVQFVSSTSDTASATLPAFAQNTFVIEAVAKPTSLCTINSQCNLFSVNGLGGAQCRVFFNVYDGSIEAQADCGTSVGGTATYSAGNAHVFGYHRTGSSSAEILVDGVSSSAAIEADDLMTGFSLGVGDMTIAEVVVAQSVSSSDVTQLDTYLRSKYGL